MHIIYRALKKKIIKKNSNFGISNKVINGTSYLLQNDLIIKELFKLNINKRNIIKYNINIIKKIKPISLFLIINKHIYKNFFK